METMESECVKQNLFSLRINITVSSTAVHSACRKQKLTLFESFFQYIRYNADSCAQQFVTLPRQLQLILATIFFSRQEENGIKQANHFKKSG